MTVVSVEEKVATRTGGDAVAKPGERDNKGQYDLTFTVIVNDNRDDVKAVLADPRLPPLGARYRAGRSADNKSRCFRRVPRHVGKYVYEVVCSFDRGKVPEPNPPTRITYGHASEQVVADSTATTSENNGASPVLTAQQPIENSAGQPFDPPLMIQRYDLTIKMQKFLDLGGYNAVAMSKIIGKVNAAPWFGFPKWWVMVTGATSSNIKLGDREVDSATVTFRVRDGGWNPVLILDRGLVAFENEQDAARRQTSLPGGDPAPITGTPAKDTNGVETGVVVNLNGQGVQKSKTEPPTWLKFDVYETATFVGLNLP